MKFYNEPSEDQWATILQRSTGDSASVEKIVHDIIDDVKINGDKALRNYAKRFENADIGDLKVTASEIAEAGKNISADLKAAIQLAYVNIKTFHESQKEKGGKNRNHERSPVLEKISGHRKSWIVHPWRHGSFTVYTAHAWNPCNPCRL